MTALYCLRDREGPLVARMYMREVPRVTSRILTRRRVADCTGAHEYLVEGTVVRKLPCRIQSICNNLDPHSSAARPIDAVVGWCVCVGVLYALFLCSLADGRAHRKVIVDCLGERGRGAGACQSLDELRKTKCSQTKEAKSA